MSKIRDEWYIIVNPHAGSGKTMTKWIPAENRLKELGVPFYTVYTTHKHHATSLAAAAARQGYRRILAVGGDGSVHEVFNGVLRWCANCGVDPSEFYLAVAPIGSGNDWIKAWGVPNDTLEAVELIAKESFAKEDVVRMEVGGGDVFYMANVGGFGFDSHVCERVNRLKDRGMRSTRIYLNSLRYTLMHLKPIEVKVEVDGTEVHSGQAFSMALGNGPYSGGGMRQCSLANPADGILDAMLVPKLSLSTILRELPGIFRGTIHLSDKIKYLRGKTITVTPLHSCYEDIIEIDGEIVGRLPLTVSVLPQQVNVLSGK